MGSQKSFEVLEEEKKSSLLGAKIISNRNFVYSFCFGHLEHLDFSHTPAISKILGRVPVFGKGLGNTSKCWLHIPAGVKSQGIIGNC